MFLYYAGRSLKNQIYRILHSKAVFLLILIVCAEVGMWIYTRHYASRPSGGKDVMQALGNLLTETGLTPDAIISLVAAAVTACVFILHVTGAEKSVSALFLQADTDILFASIRTPQEILIFRVFNAAALGILVPIPAMISLMCLNIRGMPPLAGYIPYALAMWFSVHAISIFIKIIVYEIGSRHPLFGKSVLVVCIGALTAAGICIYRTSVAEQCGFLPAAAKILNAEWTLLIPGIGWARGILVYAVEGDIHLSVLMAAMCALIAAGLYAAARHEPADYYEEVFAGTKTANGRGTAGYTPLLITESRSAKPPLHIGIGHGHGESTWFFRILHDRIRKSRFAVTKTMLLYTVAAVMTGIYLRLYTNGTKNSILAVALGIAVFFHTIVSPAVEDPHLPGFTLYPGPVWKKLLYSLSGCTVCCIIDLIPPLIAGSVAAGMFPLEGLMFIPVLAAADFFANASAVFADTFIPVSIGTSLKQLVQIILIYMGITLDGVVLLFGIGHGQETESMVITAVIDIVLGLVFTGLTWAWTAPQEGKPVRRTCIRTKEAGSAYARIIITMILMYAAIHLGQLWLTDTYPVFGLYFPIYGMGLPVFLLLAGKKPRVHIRHREPTTGKLLMLIPLCFFTMYAGSIAGLLLERAAAFLPALPSLPEVSVSQAYPELQSVMLAVAAPIMEETVFRKWVIDRLIPYGTKKAWIMSAVLFALFHTSISQICYAFCLGLVFGYVYIHTGKTVWTITVHMLVNTLSTVVLPFLFDLAIESAPVMTANVIRPEFWKTHPGVLPILVYITVLFVLSMFGMVLAVYTAREFRLPEAEPADTGN